MNDNQYSQLMKAYQNSWNQYQNGYNQLNKNSNQALRQQELQQLQDTFHKQFLNSTGQIFTSPEQRERLGQLYWQYRGYGAFQDPKVMNQVLNLRPLIARRSASIPRSGRSK